jgi:hypothetical protein
MAKAEITDYSPVASSNTDINNVGLDTPDSAGNMLPAFHEVMAALARTVAGTAPWFDTFAVMNATDNTKQANISTTNVPTGTTRPLDAEALYRNGAPRRTVYQTAGTLTHTFQAKTRYFQVEACGGGGGGGGANGVGSGKGAVASGGHSGESGVSRILVRGAIASGTVVVGARGNGGAAAGGDGATGGTTSWNDGANVFFWAGGTGGKGVVATTAGAYGVTQPANIAGGDGVTSVQPGFLGQLVAGVIARGGDGGASPYGTPGIQVSVTSGGSTGANASGSGCGGGGASIYDVASNNAGGNGSAGIVIVWEW